MNMCAPVITIVQFITTSHYSSYMWTQHGKDAWYSILHSQLQTHVDVYTWVNSQSHMHAMRYMMRHTDLSIYIYIDGTVYSKMKAMCCDILYVYNPETHSSRTPSSQHIQITRHWRHWKAMDAIQPYYCTSLLFKWCQHHSLPNGGHCHLLLGRWSLLRGLA